MMKIPLAKDHVLLVRHKSGQRTKANSHNPHLLEVVVVDVEALALINNR